MIIARQSTARTVTVGPVLDADGVAVTGGVVGDFKISKNGGAPAALNGSATATHRHTGFYSLALTASDLDTVGQAEITIDDTTNSMAMKEITVIEEAVYDISFAASATGAVPVASIAANAITATAIASDAITAAKIAAGAIDAATFAADVDAEILSYLVDDATRIDASALNTASVTSIPAILVDTGTTLQAELDGIQADTEDIQARLPAALVGGRIDATVDATGLEAGALALINAEVDTALTDIHLDHLLAATYDPASKPGAADALLNELVESDAGVARFTANALEEGPGGGSAPTAAEIADAVWTEAVADHSGVSGSTAEALAAAGGAGDPWITSLPGIYTGSQAGKILADILVDTGTTLQGELDGIQADTEDIQNRLPAALVGGRIDATVDGTGLEAGAAAVIADAVWDESQSGHVGAGTFGETATEIAAILVDTAEIGAAGAGLTEAGGTGDHLTALATAAALQTVDNEIATIDSNVDAILVDTSTTLQAELDGIQADTEDIQARLPAALVGGRIDATVDATGMEADATAAIASAVLSAAAAAPIDANIQEVNDVALIGDGSAVPWGPA